VSAGWQDLVVGLAVAVAVRFLWKRLGTPRRAANTGTFVPLGSIRRRDGRRQALPS
jgi:hypothetical protein